MSSPENYKQPVKRNSFSKLSKCSNEALTGSEENKTKKGRNTRDIETISQVKQYSVKHDLPLLFTVHNGLAILLRCCISYWLPVKYRIEYKIITLTFKAIHGTAPNYI